MYHYPVTWFLKPDSPSRGGVVPPQKEVLLMTWKIAADSSCDLREGIPPLPGLSFAIVPLKIRVGLEEFIDDCQLDLLGMKKALASFDGPTSSACPSPEEWAREFEEADCSIAVTMTSALSGTFNSAVVGRRMALEKDPEKKILVLDTKSTGGHMVLLIWRIRELIAQGLSFEEVAREAVIYNRSLRLLYTLSTFDNLVKNGRMNKLVGIVASKLGIRIVAEARDGKIEVLYKIRGQSRALEALAAEMKRQKPELSSGGIVISHCNNPLGALYLQEELEKIYPGAPVTVMETKGLTSYYAEETGILVGF